MIGPWSQAGAVPSAHRDLEGTQRGIKHAWKPRYLLPGRATCVGTDISGFPGGTSVSCVPPSLAPPAHLGLELGRL